MKTAQTTNTKPTHTQGEWKIITTISGELKIYSIKDDGRYDHCLATVHELRDETPFNAQRIVKCVNMHDELVEVLKSLRAYEMGEESWEAKDEKKLKQLLKQAEQE